MRITGKCHCGNISFNLEWEGGQPEIPARACTCSFCIKHGGVWTSNPGSVLEVNVRDSSLATRYQFATGTAEFHVCSACGVVPLVTSRIEGHTYAAVINACSACATSTDFQFVARQAARFYRGRAFHRDCAGVLLGGRPGISAIAGRPRDDRKS